MNKWWLALLGAGAAWYFFSVRKPPSDERTEFFLVDGFKSFLGLKNKPIGVRNNNPGNIKIGPSNWQKKVPLDQNTDGTFEQFTQYRYGIRALIKLLLKYKRDGDNTISKIISRYAPPIENPTANYIEFVEQETQFGRNRVLVLTPAVLNKLVMAITQFENGRAVVSQTDFDEAIVLV